MGNDKSFCHQCKHFIDNRKFQDHQRVHAMVGKFSCSHCDKLFEKKQDLKRHEKIVHFPETIADKFACDKCDKFYVHQRDLRSHEKKFHAETYVPRLRHGRNVMNGNPSEANILQSIPKSMNERFGCPYCDKTYVRQGQLKNHIQSIHSVSKETIHSVSKESPNESFCDYCNKQFASKAYHKIHLRKFHSNPNPM